MKTATQVKQALVDCIKLIQKSNGYKNDLPVDHVYSRWNQTIADDHTDSTYPKAFVVMEVGNDERMPGEQEHRFLNFLVVFIVKKLKTTDDAQAMTESFLDDAERLVNLQSDLLQNVHAVSLTHFSIDGGILDPEGALVVRLQTERFSV